MSTKRAEYLKHLCAKNNTLAPPKCGVSPFTRSVEHLKIDEAARDEAIYPNTPLAEARSSLTKSTNERTQALRPKCHRLVRPDNVALPGSAYLEINLHATCFRSLCDETSSADVDVVQYPYSHHSNHVTELCIGFDALDYSYPFPFRLIMADSRPSSVVAQGQFSWDNLAKQSISYSVDVLRRVSMSGVDRYTLTVGQAICQCFKLGPTGRKNINDALSKLRVHNGWGDVLHFGFGIESLPRLLASTDEGSCLLALMASLTDTYGSERSGEVMFRVVDALKAPERFAPSLSEWIRLGEACAGSLCASHLPVLVGQIIDDCEKRVRKRELQRREEHDDSFEFVDAKFGDANPVSVAEALLAIANLSRGNLVAVTIRGPPNIGWLAAVAMWVFDLRIQVQDEVGSQQIFSNISRSIDAQVKFILKSETGASSDQKELEIYDRSYYIDSLDDIITTDEAKFSFSGRVPWNACLQSTFGDSFVKIQSQPHILGRALGSAAAIFQRLSVGDFDVSAHVTVLLRRCETLYTQNERLRGGGYLSNCLKWFPELNTVEQKSAMFNALRTKDPVDTYQQAIQRARNLCGCEYCTGELDARTTMTACLTSIVETIIKISFLLGRAESVHSDLLPPRRGIATLHREQMSERGRGEEESFIERLLCCGPAYGDLNQWVTFEDAVTLFTGSRCAIVEPLAQCQLGICVYLDSLRHMSVNSDELLRFHVLPGRIEKAGHIYREIIEDRSACSSRNELSLERFRTPASDSAYKNTLRLLQTRSGLRALYISKQTLETVEMLRTQQAVIDALQRVLNVESHVHCNCRLEVLDGGWEKVQGGDWRAEIDGMEVFFWPNSSLRSSEELALLLACAPEQSLVLGGSCVGRAIQYIKTSGLDKGKPAFILDI